jgi:hypothetical protein
VPYTSRVIFGSRKARTRIAIFSICLLGLPAVLAAVASGSGKQGGRCSTLRQGSVGFCVKSLQRRLNRDHDVPHLTVDGTFGPLTHRVLLAYQRRHGFRADGVVRESTARALKILSHYKGEGFLGHAGAAITNIYVLSIVVIFAMILARMVEVRMMMRYVRSIRPAQDVQSLKVSASRDEVEISLSLYPGPAVITAASGGYGGYVVSENLPRIAESPDRLQLPLPGEIVRGIEGEYPSKQSNPSDSYPSLYRLDDV